MWERDVVIVEEGERGGGDVALVDIVLCVGNEVLSRGLEATVEQIACARLVGPATPLEMGLGRLARPTWPPHPLGTSCRILVVTFDQWPLLQEWSDLPREEVPRVLVIGDEIRHTDISRYSELPTDGFLALSDLSTQSLEEAFRRIAAGEMPMPASLARQLLSGGRHRVNRMEKQHIALTERESETLALLADGLSNKQIARALKISTHGAKRLVGAVLLKLGAPNRTTAVVIAMNAGLVSADGG
jgi:two-component system nitrate/nitrite response regulator NarL